MSLNRSEEILDSRGKEVKHTLEQRNNTRATCIRVIADWNDVKAMKNEGGMGYQQRNSERKEKTNRQVKVASKVRAVRYESVRR
jgi:hypothetical protein